MSSIVAIIGRPNVGKSTLFNRMIKKEIDSLKVPAITEKTPGVTRDRNYGTADWEGKKFTVVDTGGFYPEGVLTEEGETARQIREQIFFAIKEADVIIHLLDGKEGLNPSDAEMANMLRESGKKVLWVVNKIDIPAKEGRILEFYSIGANEIMPVSAISGFGFDELMDKIVSALPHAVPSDDTTSDAEPVPRIAVVGRPNVGKSTLINSLLSKKRLVVSSAPGTTRDAIDSLCTYYSKKYLFVDTAGIRKKSGGYSMRATRKLLRGRALQEPSIERLSLISAVRSIERADVAVIVLDASEDISEQDQRIAGMAEEFGKSAIFLLNKWDKIEAAEEEYKRFAKEIKNKMWFMDYVPYITVSGLKKTRLTKIFPLIDEIIAERKKRIPTAALNKFLSKLIAFKPFPLYRGKEVKFFYITQIGIEPPSFAVFVNYPNAVRAQHTRYIEKALRNEYSFKGTPIKIYVKSR
ncbi:MAG: ribosome biogenesis GTPase Der [Thermodesulfovibrio sp.]|nr:ribosome biogenesis GTPase Der [Thermodesulfovibrio sp.]